MPIFRIGRSIPPDVCNPVVFPGNSNELKELFLISPQRLFLIQLDLSAVQKKTLSVIIDDGNGKLKSRLLALLAVGS